MLIVVIGLSLVFFLILLLFPKYILISMIYFYDKNVNKHFLSEKNEYLKKNFKVVIFVKYK